MKAELIIIGTIADVNNVNDGHRITLGWCGGDIIALYLDGRGEYTKTGIFNSTKEAREAAKSAYADWDFKEYMSSGFFEQN